MVDLRFPLNCSDDYVDGVFTEHTIEHLCPLHVLNLLREIRRILKPGGWIRIVVPDLEKYVQYYLNPSAADPWFRQWRTGAEAIRCLTQNWGHRSVWDATLILRVLKEAGFSVAQLVSFGQGTDRRLIMDWSERACESLYVEGQK